MTMQSVELLPELRRLPVADGATLDVHETVSRIRTMDRGHFAIEVSQATEEVLEALFSARNVPDELNEAWRRSFSDLAYQGVSLHERYELMTERGLRSVTGFVSPLKGKVAELKVESVLEERHPSYDFRLAENPNQPGWDLIGTSPDGPDIFIQVRVGVRGYADQVVDHMERHPNIEYWVSSEVYNRITQTHPEFLDRVVDIGPAAELTEFAKDGLDTLARNSRLGRAGLDRGSPAIRR